MMRLKLNLIDTMSAISAAKFQLKYDLAEKIRKGEELADSEVIDIAEALDKARDFNAGAHGDTKAQAASYRAEADRFAEAREALFASLRVVL